MPHHHSEPAGPQHPGAAPGPQTPGLACDDARGLLPWLLNGSLAAAERRELEAHLASCEGCSEELGRTWDAVEIFSIHVPSFALAEYAQGLEPVDVARELIEAHVGRCPACREELELVRSTRILDVRASRTDGTPAPIVWSVRTGHWRLAAGVLLAAGLALLLWTTRVTDTGAGGATPIDPPTGVGLLADGFEGGDTSSWSAPVFENGFEPGDLSAWSKSSG